MSDLDRQSSGIHVPEEPEEARELRTSNLQLKPCPFCGGPAELEFDETRHHHEERKEEHRWQVFCAAMGRACPVGPCTHCTTKDEAISQWNTRATVSENHGG